MVGTNFRNEIGDTYYVEKLIIHESYLDYHNDDIALIRTDKPIVFSDLVKTIALPESNFIDSSLPAIFTGWGTLQVINSSNQFTTIKESRSKNYKSIL